MPGAGATGDLDAGAEPPPRRAGARVVDVRPFPRVNGWRGPGEARGGHVPGAVALPAAWLSRLADADLQDAARGQGHRRRAPRSSIYGDGEDVSLFRDRLASEHRGAAADLADGWPAGRPTSPSRSSAWRATSSSSTPTGSPSCSPAALPEAAPAGPLLLFHVNFGVPEEYADGHLPGALYLDTNLLESPRDWNRRSPEELDAALRALGITSDTTVILYGRDTEGEANEKWPGRRAGQIAATRAALILSLQRRRGRPPARRWLRRLGAERPRARDRRRVPDLGSRVRRRGPGPPELIVDIEEAKEILADPDGAALVSVRTWSEHIGTVSGYNYIGPAGRIAGDVWGNCGTDAYHMQHYRNLDNTMRPYPEIAANWAEAGITPDKWVAFYCGTGWRASETWFYAYLMGWPRIAVYDGGWWEWSKDPGRQPDRNGAARATSLTGSRFPTESARQTPTAEA